MKNPKELISEYIELLNSDISEGPVFTGAENIFIAEAKNILKAKAGHTLIQLLKI